MRRICEYKYVDDDDGKSQYSSLKIPLTADVGCVNMESNLNLKSNTLLPTPSLCDIQLGGSEGDFQHFKLVVLIKLPLDKCGNEIARILGLVTLSEETFGRNCELCPVSLCDCQFNQQQGHMTIIEKHTKCF